MIDPITGAVTGTGAPPAAPCWAGTDVTAADLTYTHGTDPMGQVRQVSDERVF
jgi:hypothetical protein